MKDERGPRAGMVAGKSRRRFLAEGCAARDLAEGGRGSLIGAASAMI